MLMPRNQNRISKWTTPSTPEKNETLETMRPTLHPGEGVMYARDTNLMQELQTSPGQALPPFRQKHKLDEGLGNGMNGRTQWNGCRLRASQPWCSPRVQQSPQYTSSRTAGMHSGVAVHNPQLAQRKFAT